VKRSSLSRRNSRAQNDSEKSKILGGHPAERESIDKKPPAKSFRRGIQGKNSV